MTAPTQVSIIRRGFCEKLIFLRIPIDLDFEDSHAKNLIMQTWRKELNVPWKYPQLRLQIEALKNSKKLFKICEMNLAKKGEVTYIDLQLYEISDINSSIREIENIFMSVTQYRV